MTQPPEPPPPDPDANLSDDEKVQKARFKRWFAESFKETVTELRNEAPPEPPAKTRPPENKGFDIMGSLFGGRPKSS
jgi:hypothetical protein